MKLSGDLDLLDKKFASIDFNQLVVNGNTDYVQALGTNVLEYGGMAEHFGSGHITRANMRAYAFVRVIISAYWMAVIVTLLAY